MKNAKYMIIVILLVLIIVLLAAIFISQKNENSKKEEDEIKTEQQQEQETTLLEAKDATMSLKDKENYNLQFERYSGEIKGKKVKELLEEIIQNNDNGVNELGKFVSVHTKNISSYKGNVEDVCEQANDFEDGENTTKNVENAKKEIKNLIEKIEEEKLYTVKTSKEQGAVYAVEISEK